MAHPPVQLLIYLDASTVVRWDGVSEATTDGDDPKTDLTVTLAIESLAGQQLIAGIEMEHQATSPGRYEGIITPIHVDTAELELHGRYILRIDVDGQQGVRRIPVRAAYHGAQ